MKTIALLFCFFIATNMLAQDYNTLIKQADSLYRASNYKSSGITYEKIFRMFSEKFNSTDAYNAACSWALAGNTQKAFYFLKTSITKGYNDYKHASQDKDLEKLHIDKSWKKYLKQIKGNYTRKYNIQLINQLEQIYFDDQKYRNQIDSVLTRFGNESLQWNSLLKQIEHQDSINEQRVINILNQYRWVGPNRTDGNAVEAIHSYYLFLILQHATLSNQIKYLPLLKDAIEKKNARPRDYAFVQDRILMRQGKFQQYGTQLSMIPETKEVFVWPVTDVDNLDKRRKEIGMQTMAFELKQLHSMNWNIESYKEKLPYYIKFTKVAE